MLLLDFHRNVLAETYIKASKISCHKSTCGTFQSYFASGTLGASPDPGRNSSLLSRRRRFALIDLPLDGAWTFDWRGGFILTVIALVVILVVDVYVIPP